MNNPSPTTMKEYCKKHSLRHGKKYPSCQPSEEKESPYASGSSRTGKPLTPQDFEDAKVAAREEKECEHKVEYPEPCGNCGYDEGECKKCKKYVTTFNGGKTWEE